MPTPRKARRFRNEPIRHVPVAAADALIQNGKRVAHAAVCRNGDEHRGIVVDCHIFLRADPLKAPCDVLRCDAAEVKTLTAR